jgi:hypothetical protein
MVANKSTPWWPARMGSEHPADQTGELCQFIHGWLTVAQHAEQARLDDREVVLGGSALEQRPHAGTTPA